MYFDETQLIEAFQYLTECKQKTKKDEYYVCVPQYFDSAHLKQKGWYGITVRAEYKDHTDTFHIFITPHFECFRYELLQPNYQTLLETSFLVDKIKELCPADQTYCVKVDNKHKIFEGTLTEGIEECEEEKCFFVK